MPFDLEFVLAQYEGVPVVDIFGVVDASSSCTPSQHASDMWNCNFRFAGWRIDDQAVQLRSLPMTAVGSHEALTVLRERLQKDKIIHIKARIVWKPSGYPFGLLDEWVGPVHDEILNELQRQLGKPAYFNSPPLPTLRATEYFWEGAIHLPLISDQSIDIAIEKTERKSTFPGPLHPLPTSAQISALRYFVENQETIYCTLFQSIYASYPEWRELYDSDPEYMPEISSAEELKAMIRLEALQIPLVERNGIGYLLFHFHSSWDREHGFNAAMHKSRLFYLNDSDPNYAARNDARLAEDQG